MADRALVFDFGTRRIGVASASRLAGTVTALATLPAHDGVPEWQEVAALIRDWQPEVLVVGLPRNTDGTDSAMTRRSRSFGQWLAGRSGLLVEEIDERYTSAEAEAVLREQRRDGSRRRRVQPADIDLMAARLMAETWLRS
ncbi:MAG: putative pre-16S rRNA nuclease [Gammaproteobacteria bacterium]|nr:MAG: putative pre-16S rRNA nuclease [Gammaproteobacteria bacterium]